MMAVGMFLAPIAMAVLVIVWVAYYVIVQPVSLSLADPETRGGCLFLLGVIAATGLLYYLLYAGSGSSGGGWSAAALLFAGVLAVALWCGFCASVLADRESRWGCAAVLGVLCVVAAASYSHLHFAAAPGEPGWSFWAFLIAGALVAMGAAGVGASVLIRLFRNPGILGAVALAVGVAWAAIHFLGFPFGGWMGLMEAMARWTGFAWLALTDLPALLSLAGYGGLAAATFAAVRQDDELRLGLLVVLSAIAVTVPASLLLNGWLSLWLAIPIALAVACVVVVVCLGLPSATRVPLPAGVAVAGVLVALLVGFLTAGPDEDGQGALGGVAPEPAGEAHDRNGGAW